MRRRRAAGLALVVMGTAATLLALVSTPAAAAAPDQTGWWFELQTSPLPAPLPAPPNVPDGGLYVQQGPDGPTAYSAVRATASGLSSATLLLTVSTGSSTALPAAMQACATEGGWSPPQSEPGAWDNAPKYGQNCVPGIIASDGTAVAFHFSSSYFTGGALDVAIVPTAAATPFAIAFDKPGDSSLQTDAGATPAVPPSTPAAPSRPVASAAGGSRPAASPSAPSAPTPTTAPPAPAAAPATGVASNLLNIAGLGDPDRGQRMLALGGASLIVLGWWLLSTKALPMPRLLGALAGSSAASVGRVGGVGRFAKARETDPNLLR